MVVGTAGLRQAANSDEFLAAVRERAGVEVEVISGDEEARLSYLAAAEALHARRGQGSACSRPAAAARSSRSAKAGAWRSASASTSARSPSPSGSGSTRPSTRRRWRRRATEIASQLGALEGRPPLDVLAGIGGAITNLAGVQLGLERYEPGRVRGLELEAAEVDRQIELYRTRDAEERRSIRGLQPKRAEVILAGACIVRTVLAELGRDSLTVSDQGLRHGVLLERFSA